MAKGYMETKFSVIEVRLKAGQVLRIYAMEGVSIAELTEGSEMIGVSKHEKASMALCLLQEEVSIFYVANKRSGRKNRLDQLIADGGSLEAKVEGGLFVVKIKKNFAPDIPSELIAQVKKTKVAANWNQSGYRFRLLLGRDSKGGSVPFVRVIGNRKSPWDRPAFRTGRGETLVLALSRAFVAEQVFD